MVRRVYVSTDYSTQTTNRRTTQRGVNLKQSCFRAGIQDSGKNTGTITVVHNHFSTIIDLFVLPCGPFGRNKSEY